MKTLLILIMSAGVACAGTFTINTTAQQDTRIDAAIRSILNLDHDPSDAEVTTFLRRFLIDTVQDYERREAIRTFTPPPFP